jgi:5-methyltetrahydrofolate--homocysteine methyltransferase
MRGVIEAVRAADDMPNLRVIVGGAAVTNEFAQQIGADGWAPDAGSAVILALRVVAEARAAATAGAGVVGAGVAG